MVKRSKKSKSKRVTLRQKYKVLRKVKEHHKKKAKEAKKLGVKRKAKVEKDPGIPNAWPFKEQELQALEERRARGLKELEEKKAAKKLRAKERAERRKLGLPPTEDDTLEQLVRNADARATEFDEVKKRSARTPSKDGSKKAFYKELLKVIEESDVVIEVLDARDPMGTRCSDVERLVYKSGSPKRLVLLLNKIDLVPKEIAEKWLKYLREELPTVAFKCSTQKQKANLGRKKAKTNQILETSDCLGAETLLQLLKNYSRSAELKRAITVGIVGLPNVGKSSLINSLKRTRVANAGATPGITRAMQEVQLDKHVKLLDCPGVVLVSAKESSDSVDLRNCVKIEKLSDPVAPVKEILRICGHEKLTCIYKISSFSSVDEFLQLVATVRGKFKKGGVVDTITAAKIVLYEWNEGKIPHYTIPPVRESTEPSESAIVASWGKEFNVDEVFKNEQSTVIAGLPSLSDTDHSSLPANTPMTMDTTMLQEESEQEEDSEKEEEAVETEPQEMDTNEGSVSAGKEAAVSSSTQTQKLYDAEGIFNPRLARAERKRRKKTSKSDEGGEEAMEGTYDFETDYVETEGAAAPVIDKTKTGKKKKRKSRDAVVPMEA